MGFEPTWVTSPDPKSGASAIPPYPLNKKHSQMIYHLWLPFALIILN